MEVTLMTPREIIKRNLGMSDPERIGMAFDGGRKNDFCSAGLDLDRIWKMRSWVEGDVEYYDDVGGNLWHRLVHMSKGGEVFEPVIKDWSDLDDYELPELDAPELYEQAKARFAADEDHYHVSGLPGFPFAICRYLRKMEIYFTDLVLERERIDELHDRVTGLLERMIKRCAEIGADGIIFCEDWGTQDSLLVSPSMWREIFKPLFVRLCNKASTSGLHVLMHSCGYNWDILEDLAEVGVCCFQFDQPALYGIERLAEKLKEIKVCLYSPVDIQQILPTGDRDLITSNARRMIELFGKPHGGLIAKNYGDLEGIGVKREWDGWAYDTFDAYSSRSSS